MPNRPVAKTYGSTEKLQAARSAPGKVNDSLEWLPEFPAPKHTAGCGIASGEDCVCGIADARLPGAQSEATKGPKS